MTLGQLVVMWGALLASVAFLVHLFVKSKKEDRAANFNAMEKEAGIISERLGRQYLEHENEVIKKGFRGCATEVDPNTLLPMIVIYADQEVFKEPDFKRIDQYGTFRVVYRTVKSAKFAGKTVSLKEAKEIGLRLDEYWTKTCFEQGCMDSFVGIAVHDDDYPNGNYCLLVNFTDQEILDNFTFEKPETFEGLRVKYRIIGRPQFACLRNTSKEQEQALVDFAMKNFWTDHTSNMGIHKDKEDNISIGHTLLNKTPQALNLPNDFQFSMSGTEYIVRFSYFTVENKTVALTSSEKAGNILRNYFFEKYNLEDNENVYGSGVSGKEIKTDNEIENVIITISLTGKDQKELNLPDSFEYDYEGRIYVIPVEYEMAGEIVLHGLSDLDRLYIHSEYMKNYFQEGFGLAGVEGEKGCDISEIYFMVSCDKPRPKDPELPNKVEIEFNGEKYTIPVKYVEKSDIEKVVDTYDAKNNKSVNV